MIERPILFSAPMVQALLDGSKTQTRRVVKPRPDRNMGPHCVLQPHELAGEVNRGDYQNCPYGQPGDRLWVRETWQGPLLQEFEMDADPDWHRASNIHQYQSHKHCEYAADGGPKPEYTDTDDVMHQGWRPSIHMPRWASRITLEVTGVRVERLQEISENDAWAEGCEGFDDDVSGGKSGYQEYAELWEQINGNGSWNANPWVWVIEFKRVKP